MSTDTEIPNVAIEPSTTIGLRLKMTREARGLKRNDIADQLKLNEKFIIMIEDEKYPPDLPLTFVRGYIRSYAKLLAIPDAEVIKGLEPIKPIETAPVVEPIVREMTPVTSDNYYMKILSGLLALTMAALVSIWWFNHSKEPVQDSATMTEVSSSRVATPPAVVHLTQNEAAPGQVNDQASTVAPEITPTQSESPVTTPNIEKAPHTHHHGVKISHILIYSLIFLLLVLFVVFYRFKTILRPTFAEPENLLNSIAMALRAGGDSSFEDDPIPDHEILKKMRICLMLIGITVASLAVTSWFSYYHPSSTKSVLEKKVAKKSTPYTPVVETSVPDSLLSNVDQEKIPTDTLTQRTEETSTPQGQMNLLYPIDETKYTPIPKGTFEDD